MRTPKPVNEAALRAAIQRADEEGQPNENALWKRAAALYAVDNPEVSFSVVMLRAKAWGLSYKTPKGRQGRPPSSQTAPRTPEPSQASHISQSRLTEPRTQPQSPVRTTLGRGTIYAPAGEPPVKLRSTSREDVLEWASAIRRLNPEKNYSSNAFLYWVDHYFYSRLDHKQDFQKISEILLEEESGSVSM